MGNILFISDIEEGHLLPTFGLAQALQTKGYQVTYLNVPDNEKIITEQGFAFQAIGQQLYPPGFKQQFKKLRLLPEQEMHQQVSNIRTKHLQHLPHMYDPFLKQQPDLVIVSFYLPFDLLTLYYKYGIQPVIFNPILREAGKPIINYCQEILAGFTLEEKCALVDLFSGFGNDFDSFEQLFAPLTTLHELILCPGELCIDNDLDTNTRVHYTDAPIRKRATLIDVYETYNIPAGKKILYSAMGSQAIRHGMHSDLFFSKMINIMKHPEFTGLHLVLCVGNDYDQNRLGAIPGNVTVLGWGPQIDILSVASAAIIHGGLGTVKECIYFGVPMLVFPQGFDQPLNGQRVVHHGMGFCDDIETVSETGLRHYLLSLLHDSSIKAAVLKMQQLFRDKEEKQTGVCLVESMLTVPSL